MLLTIYSHIYAPCRGIRATSKMASVDFSHQNTGAEVTEQRQFRETTTEWYELSKIRPIFQSLKVPLEQQMCLYPLHDGSCISRVKKCDRNND
jgi:hypothetical protein